MSREFYQGDLLPEGTLIATGRGSVTVPRRIVPGMMVSERVLIPYEVPPDKLVGRPSAHLMRSRLEDDSTGGLSARVFLWGSLSIVLIDGLISVSFVMPPANVTIHQTVGWDLTRWYESPESGSSFISRDARRVTLQLTVLLEPDLLVVSEDGDS